MTILSMRSGAIATTLLLGVCDTATAQQLTLAVSTDKSIVIPGEPVVVHLTVANDGDSVEIPGSLEARYGVVEYLIRYPDGSERAFRPWALFESNRRITLPRGGRHVASSRIFFGADGWTFREQGTYAIRAAWGERAASAIALEVRAPAGPEAEQSQRLLGSDQAGLFLLLDGGDHLTNGTELLRDLARSETRFAGYAAHALGASRAVRFSNLATGQVREARLPEAREYLERAGRLLPADAWYFKDRGVDQLDTVLRVQGQGVAANTLQRDFRAQLQRANLPTAIREQMIKTTIIRQ